jgi:hypothetical protein
MAVGNRGPQDVSTILGVLIFIRLSLAIHIFVDTFLKKEK